MASVHAKSLTANHEPESANRMRQVVMRPATRQSLTRSQYGLCGHQVAAGNMAVQRRMRHSTAQNSLQIGSPGDSYEREADRSAEQVVTHKAAPCSCAGSCPKCRGQAPLIVHRKTSAPGAGTAMGGVSAMVPSGGGSAMDSATRSEMEQHFGHDFSSVNLHTGTQADRSAHVLNAQAYTLGQDIVFRAGAYQPHTDAGKNLLAHELTHVVQQKSAPVLRRRVDGDVRHLCITPAWAKALTDKELTEQQFLLENYLVSLTRLLANSPEYRGAQENLETLAQEQKARIIHGGSASEQAGQSVPRPPGLPIDGGYTLQELSDLAPDIAAQIPGGQLVTINPGGNQRREDRNSGGSSDESSGWLEGAGGGAYSGLRSANAALMSYGFNPAGDFAIGIVAIPSANLNPFSANFNPVDLAVPLTRAGHTAVYVRQGGKITIVRGYNPQMDTPSSFMNVARNQGEIFTGKMGVPGNITSDTGLFQSTAARTIEYPVTPEVAASFVETLPQLGPPGAGMPPFYTAPPSEYANVTGTETGCVGTNCGLWATRQVEAALGGRVGAAGEPPVVDIPNIGQASQGKLYGMLGDVQNGAPAAEMPGASGPAIPGEMGAGLTVLKWGGRVFLVASVAKLGYDIWNAPPEERPHVAVVGASSFAGGFAGGAALGLVCGPGAPVCSIVTGIIGGVLGGLGAGKVADAVWDFGRSMMWLAGHENPEDTQYFEEQDRAKRDEMMGIPPS